MFCATTTMEYFMIKQGRTDYMKNRENLIVFDIEGYYSFIF